MKHILIKLVRELFKLKKFVLYKTKWLNKWKSRETQVECDKEEQLVRQEWLHRSNKSVAAQLYSNFEQRISYNSLLKILAFKGKNI